LHDIYLIIKTFYIHSKVEIIIWKRKSTKTKFISQCILSVKPYLTFETWSYVCICVHTQIVFKQTFSFKCWHLVAWSILLPWKPLICLIQQVKLGEKKRMLTIRYLTHFFIHGFFRRSIILRSWEMYSCRAHLQRRIRLRMGTRWTELW